MEAVSTQKYVFSETLILVVGFKEIETEVCQASRGEVNSRLQ